MTLRASSISIVATPKTPADREKLRRGVARIMADDPPFQAIASPDGRETILSAADMPHLERVVDRLKREFGVEAGIGNPASTDADA